MTTDKEIKDLSTLPLLITAGNALLTFLSKVTGKHFTFHIKEGEGELKGYIVRYNNKSIGTIKDMAFHIYPKAFKLTEEQTAFAWIWKNVINTPNLEKNVRVFHHGKCAKCGRTLTTPESINRGIGPECFKLVFKQ